MHLCLAHRALVPHCNDLCRAALLPSRCCFVLSLPAAGKSRWQLHEEEAAADEGPGGRRGGNGSPGAGPGQAGRQPGGSPSPSERVRGDGADSSDEDGPGPADDNYK